jgi:hypothetical protein
MSDFSRSDYSNIFIMNSEHPSFNFFLRRSDVGVELVTPPSVLEIVWISLNINYM